MSGRIPPPPDLRPGEGWKCGRSTRTETRGSQVTTTVVYNYTITDQRGRQRTVTKTEKTTTGGGQNAARTPQPTWRAEPVVPRTARRAEAAAPQRRSSAVRDEEAARAADEGLPEGWQAVVEASGRTFYINTMNGQRSYTRPGPNGKDLFVAAYR